MIVLKWLLLVNTVFAIRFLYETEHTAWMRKLQRMRMPEGLGAFYRQMAVIAEARASHVFLALFVMVSIIALYDWRMEQMRAPAEAPVAATNTIPIEQLVVEPESEPESAPEAAQESAPIELPPGLMLYDAVHAFAEKGGVQEAELDLLKQHYESLLVVHYILQRCGTVKANDYAYLKADILKAVQARGVDVSGASNLLNSILSGARGSYVELYSAGPCDKMGIGHIQSMYDAYMQHLSRSLRPGTDKTGVN